MRWHSSLLKYLPQNERENIKYQRCVHLSFWSGKWSQTSRCPPREGWSRSWVRRAKMEIQAAVFTRWPWIFIVADFEIFNICDLSFHSTHLLPYDLQFLHRKFLSFIWWIFSCFVGPAALQINICRY